MAETAEALTAPKKSEDEKPDEAIAQDDPTPIEPSNPLKRERDSPESPYTKRRRFSREGSDRASPPAPQPSKEPNGDRRKAFVDTDRRRGQRLFGGLLNTLSQKPSNVQQKRRAEIEQRQAEKAKAQKIEDERIRAERLVKLRNRRAKEQVKFDEQSMRIRHSNMLAQAQFLVTRTEPKLYYKPWELLPSETTTIDRQIAEAESQIDREVAEFKRLHPRDEKERSEREKSEPETDQQMVESSSAQVQEESSVNTTADDTNPQAGNTKEADEAMTDDTGDAHAKAVQAQKEADDKDDGGEVEVDDEDTVIY